MVMNRQRYLVAYDIEDDKLRNRVAKLLERSGLLVQKSVFECLLEPKARDRLSLSRSRLLDEGSGADIRVEFLRRVIGSQWLEKGTSGEPRWAV